MHFMRLEMRTVHLKPILCRVHFAFCSRCQGLFSCCGSLRSSKYCACCLWHRSAACTLAEMPITEIAAAAAEVVCSNNDSQLSIDSRAALGMSVAAAVMAFAATRTKLGFKPLLVASGLQAALFAGTLYMTVGRFDDCAARVNVYSPGNLWDEMSGVSSDTLDSPISAVVDATKNPLSHWLFSALSKIFFYSFGIPLNVRQLVFVVCAFALAAPVSGAAIASVGIVGCVLAALASAVYEFPIVTAARLVNATLIGPYVLAFHAVANVIAWIASLFPWLVDSYLAGMLIFTALCAVATIMLRCVVKLPHLHSLRTGILQQMFVLATQWALQLPSWHPIWLTMLPVMHRTGNSDPPPSTTLRLLGARLAIPPAMAAAVGLHARGSKADAASENVATAGASSIWRLVYSACLSLTTVLGRGYIIMEVMRYFPWLLPPPVRALLASPGEASPTPGVQAFTRHRMPAWELDAADSDGMMAPDAITQDIGSAAYFALQGLGSVVVVPMAAVPGLGNLATACSHRITVLQLALMHPAFASTLNGVARFLLGYAMCAFGAKWARRVTGIRHGGMGVLCVLLLPCLLGVNLAYVYGMSIGESLVVALGASVLAAYMRMLPQCRSMLRRSPVERAVRRLNQHWSKQRLASELSGMVVVGIVLLRVALGCAASFFGAVLLVREWPRALWWMRVTLAGQTLALDAAPRLHALSPVLAGTLVIAVAALSVVWKVNCLQQQHQVLAPQHAKALATLLDWPAAPSLPRAQAEELIGSISGGSDGSGQQGGASDSMDLYDIAETWSEGSVDLSVGVLTPSPSADDDGDLAGGDAAPLAGRGGGRPSVWWPDSSTEGAASSIGWWRQQGTAAGTGAEGASEGGSSHGGILGSMSQLFEGVAMGRMAVGGATAGLGAASAAGSDPDPTMAQTGDPAYGDSDGGTLNSGNAERETNSHNSGLRQYASLLHPGAGAGRRGTASSSGEFPDSVLDAASNGRDAHAQLDEFWRHDHHFGAHEVPGDDDDTASVMSAATMAGTSRREAHKALRRRRHNRSRSTGRIAPDASRRPGAGAPLPQRRARTSVHDSACAPADSAIECDAPSVLHQQMTPAMGPIGAPPTDGVRDLDELSFARGQRHTAPGQGDAATYSSSQRFPSSTIGLGGYSYSPWGAVSVQRPSEQFGGADVTPAPHGRFGGADVTPAPRGRSMPNFQIRAGIEAQHTSSGEAQRGHQPHLSAPTLNAGLGGLLSEQSGRPPRAEATAGAGHALSVRSPPSSFVAQGTSLGAESASPDLLSSTQRAPRPLPQASFPQYFSQPSPLPPVTMSSGGQTASQHEGVHAALPPLRPGPPFVSAQQGGVKRTRGRSADSEAFDVDLTARVSASHSRSMDSAATAPAGLMAAVHTPLPTPEQPTAMQGEAAAKKPRPLHSSADEAAAHVHSVASDRAWAERQVLPPPVEPPTPPSSVAAAASTSRLSTVPASVHRQVSSSSAALDDSLMHASASVSASAVQLPLLSPAIPGAAGDSQIHGGGDSENNHGHESPTLLPSHSSTAHST